MKMFAAFMFLLVCNVAMAQVLPAQFVHDRIFIVVPAPDGTEVRFYTDTGGGWNAISETVVERLKLPRTGSVESETGSNAVIAFPEFLKRAGVPAPVPDPWLRGQLVVTSADDILGDDGFLGSRWFAGRVWSLDYVNRKMAITSKWQAAPDQDEVTLGFAIDANGTRLMNFPRIAIVVDDQPIDVLFDTGATAKLSAAAAAQVGLQPETHVGASYIVKSIFDRWRKDHPEWKVIEGGDTVLRNSVAMIEVPRVTIGKTTVGPVWFAQRPDANFHGMMSSMMDKRVEGAIGGSAFKYLHLVIDYPNARAYLRTRVQ